MLVVIEGNKIYDWDSFHRVFKDAFGFPEFYGYNMNAWIDCMASLDEAGTYMSSLTIQKNDLIVIQLEDFTSFQKRLPEQCSALIDAIAFVNLRRRMEQVKPILALLPVSSEEL